MRDWPGLWRIWFDFTATPQYYPLVHTSFWLEYHLWGLNPLWFHLVNVALHALAALLLWRVLLHLRVPGAWLAAAIFAVHPVEVESVAWITERKNVLSAVFYFAAALAYLRFAGQLPDADASRPARHDLLSWFARVLFLALLSKTVACSLPAALLLVHWWKSERLRWRGYLAAPAFFVVGLGGIMHRLDRAASCRRGRRGLVAHVRATNFDCGRALWFYAGKLLWPVHLTFIYPRWDIRPGSVWPWLFPMAACRGR